MNLIKSTIVKIWGQKYTTQEKHCAAISMGVIYISSPLIIKWFACFLDINLEDKTNDFDKIILTAIVLCTYIVISNLILYHSFMGVTNFFKNCF